MLQIGPVIEQAEEIAKRVEVELPTHPGLLRTARRTVQAANEAQELHKRLERLFGLHRLPAAFLLVAVGLLAFWAWWHFLHTSTVTIATSESDAVELGQQLDRRVQFVHFTTSGSRESLARLKAGEADMAFVQGGVPIPNELPRIELPDQELLLLFVRDRIQRPSEIRVILTSSEGQGSHSLAQRFARYWRIDGTVRYVHEWKSVLTDPAYKVPAEVDAIFVVKDPLDERIATVPKRLVDAGFELSAAELGAGALALPCLSQVQLTPGYLDPVNGIPPQALPTYSVKTYLVARTDLSPRQMAAARRLVDPSANVLTTTGTMSTVDEASELLQGVEAFLGILVYIGLAFVALLGVDVVIYRQRFHELNSLISLVSMHQAAKDVLGVDAAAKAHDIAYLRFCSDVLGLISAITGYYAQENSSLLYNKMLEIISQRADALKLNIQLKILHAMIELPVGVPAPEAVAEVVVERGETADDGGGIGES